MLPYKFLQQKSNPNLFYLEVEDTDFLNVFSIEKPSDKNKFYIVRGTNAPLNGGGFNRFLYRKCLTFWGSKMLVFRTIKEILKDYGYIHVSYKYIKA